MGEKIIQYSSFRENARFFFLLKLDIFYKKMIAYEII